jgi:hypothetical protein
MFLELSARPTRQTDLQEQVPRGQTCFCSPPAAARAEANLRKSSFLGCFAHNGSNIVNRPPTSFDKALAHAEPGDLYRALILRGKRFDDLILAASRDIREECLCCSPTLDVGHIETREHEANQGLG